MQKVCHLPAVECIRTTENIRPWVGNTCIWLVAVKGLICNISGEAAREIWNMQEMCSPRKCAPPSPPPPPRAHFLVNVLPPSTGVGRRTQLMEYGLRAFSFLCIQRKRFQHIKSVILALLDSINAGNWLRKRLSARGDFYRRLQGRCHQVRTYARAKPQWGHGCPQVDVKPPVPANFNIIDRHLMSRWSNAKRQRYVECSRLI